MDSSSLNLEILKKYNFANHLRREGITLKRKPLTTLQINLGKKCNQACHHCHVDAGPKRTEQMDQKTAERVIAILKNSPSVGVIDITGGAPELNPNFQFLVTEAKMLERHVMDRCNLTILLEKGQENLAEFLAENEVEIVASLPCYSSENVDAQRGRGVFERSIKGLQELNQLGYGKPESGLVINLVYNPIGGTLPPPQASLETEYKNRLKAQFGIEFNNLFTITNMPISRFASQLYRNDQLDNYMNLLVDAFNPSTVDDLMCRSLISVGWQGNFYDCDFNQMLEMEVPGMQKTLWSVNSIQHFQDNAIAIGSHCFGCAAGSGSSCGGTLS
ncbi:MAG: arsenosugar biosynthesis radical SAM protein ArsS [SAR324 cluster bacterium]|nr:arsenosugar biosynthesis radical SAM protein ArsS [SAR324 cluster bacterium]